jgi:hypothetical protein
VNDWQHDLASCGFVFLDGHSSATVGGQLGRCSGPQMLIPRETAAADAWSLSGVYGLGAFPWHTDGAISSNPPRWLLLRALRVSKATCTELLDPDPQLQKGLSRTVLRARDRAGRVRYLPGAIPKDGRLRLRWDPRTCTPRTGLTVEEMEQQSSTVTVEWREDLLLIVDNARLLHRRPAVDERMDRVLERTYVWED